MFRFLKEVVSAHEARLAFYEGGTLRNAIPREAVAVVTIPVEEKEDFLNWTKTVKYQWGNHYFRHNGAGEMLTFLVADFEDFRLPRSDLPAEMEDDLEGVVRILVQNRWPSDGLLV